MLSYSPSFCHAENLLLATLVQNLNDLLTSLELPITIKTPFDLTPSLLLAILESILRYRLPLSNATRQSENFAAKVEAMKIFLGVLEDDVLQTDIGLSEIDPRRLATGEWDEVVFVGAALCWLGHRREHMDNAYTSQAGHPDNSFSSKCSRTSTSHDTGLSQYNASETTVEDDRDSESPVVNTCSHQVQRCIHEFDVSSFSFDTQFSETELCDCSFDLDGGSKLDHASHNDSPDRPSVRYQGLIRPVEDDTEEFKLWHERRKSCVSGITPTYVGVYFESIRMSFTECTFTVDFPTLKHLVG